MAKAPVIDEADLRHMIKVAGATGESPVRDTAMVYALYGLGLMLTELATLPLSTLLAENGAVLAESEIPAAIAYNGRKRPLFWTNRRVVAALEAYLAVRVHLGHGVTTRKAAFRGLDPKAPIFLSSTGEPYRLTERRSPAGVVSYSCDAMSQVVRRLHAQAGVDGGHAGSARRTFGVRLYRKGYDLRHVAELVGHKSLN
ncbi:tyrosine-type recombinase/integrase [Burkholderia vietnamiensis]|uniref:tyrosine-type recombinase/integrase n=1 Tax=Burkholderia vietnamiensis TaxID=60552 RepID=UPI0009BA566A|nr:tyrosine-type recombinase/integrase [Burkholderia vietnamiensis]